jgi:hypothetical protein
LLVGDTAGLLEVRDEIGTARHQAKMAFSGQEEYE